MAILAGNLASKISFRLQCCVFSVPLVKRSTVILCLKGREHSSSSVPVRYIPKNSSKVNELEKSLPAKGSEKRVFDKNLNGFGRTSNLNEDTQNGKQTYKKGFLLDPQQGLKEEINHDAKVKLIHCELMEEPKEVIMETAIEHESVTSKMNVQAGKTMLDAEKMAIEILATRAYTAVELRKKLHGKRFPPDIVEALITDFQSRGLINDSLYAETFSRSRWSSSSWGPRRIKQALFRKGVSNADAEKAIKLVFEDGECTGQESKYGMSKLSMNHIFVQASKQWLRGKDVPKETRKSRIIRWLQYRGFSWGVISLILKKLESQYTS
ncbi:hypothetical protein P3X46_016958 [Hevea brasiliensis]|uniref:Regulatory protein RecX n=1 Tax=Hevea brasiliensis TaxID=3981 RepID=A0ABQ9M2U7_HEVBR|nr:hypothetical protein P3X46_016958 [Hevea brasiliensis]